MVASDYSETNPTHSVEREGDFVETESPMYFLRVELVCFL